jgi:hypothetical protein
MDIETAQPKWLRRFHFGNSHFPQPLVICPEAR